MAFLKLAASMLATLALYGLYKLARIIYGELTSPLRDMPGPKSSSWFYGNFKEIFKAENSVLHEQWVDTYGSTLKYKGLFNLNRLYTVDTKALNHVLMNSNIYQKPAVARRNLSHILGAGVLVVEGEKHRQQRKVMNPAFGPVQIRELTNIFVQKAIKLRDLWSVESSKEGGTARVDVLSWLSRMTLDVIGLAGFNYEFNALNPDEKPNELNHAFSVMFKATSQFEIFPVLQGFFPILRVIKTQRDRTIEGATAVMSRIGQQLLASSKKSLAESEKGVHTDSIGTRNLLSLLVKANTSAGHLRLSDEDVLSQVPTFLVAGHETTSTGTTWALFALTQALQVQAKLRAELLTVPTDTPTMDELNALPYLDAVVRETLRVHAPVPSTIRVAVEDDIIPLSEGWTDKHGVVHNEVHVKKGQTIFVPILAMNRSKAIWGEDGHEFKPERWEKVPEAAMSIPGVWGNMMTFLGGPRACIGYRFSLVEMKALLFTLVRAFEFELAVPASEIGKKSAVVQRPVLLSNPDAGNTMPLLLKPVQRS
ncbi:hypothetical protein HGRIS_013770 [Hohenbuehelia grisea]|uniref:Cytochrome P450 n=1 Tax=Hohenbuehelia grisea TaxID=104357 RepID=A0ABR3IWH6_9AGAR